MHLEVLEEGAVLLGDVTFRAELDELGGQIQQGLLVEVVLVRLHVAELREALVAAVKEALERLLALVSFLMRLYVALLGEGLVTLAALVGPLASMAALVRLQVAELGKGEVAALVPADLCCVRMTLKMGQYSTYIWALAGVGALVDVEVSLLGEALVAVGAITEILLGLGGSLRGFLRRGARRHLNADWA